MPTGSSTIFGVFQLIRVSQVVWRDVRAGYEPRSTADATQVRRIEAEEPCAALTADTSLLDKAISLLDKAMRNTSVGVGDGTEDSGGKENRGIVLSRTLFALRHSFRDLRGHPCDHNPEDHSLHSSQFFWCCRQVLRTTSNHPNPPRPRPLCLRRLPGRSDSAQSGWTSSGSTIARFRSTSAGPRCGPAIALMSQQDDDGHRSQNVYLVVLYLRARAICGTLGSQLGRRVPQCQRRM